MSELFFTSDHHWGHDNVIVFSSRPFDTVEEMDHKMIEAWNSVVKPGDKVFYLGDFLMGKIEKTLGYVHHLNGEITLIPGNHDKCHQGYWNHGEKDYHYWTQKYLIAGVKEVVQSGGAFPIPTIKIGDHTVRMNHFPPVGDSYEKKYADKFSAYRPENEGFIMHGHTHSKTTKSDNWIHVGVDAWDFLPVHIDWVKALIQM